jgi:hypothetical protein
MRKLIGFMTVIATLALAGAAVACSMHQSASNDQQTVASAAAPDQSAAPATTTTTTTTAPKTPEAGTGG